MEATRKIAGLAKRAYTFCLGSPYMPPANLPRNTLTLIKSGPTLPLSVVFAGAKAALEEPIRALSKTIFGAENEITNIVLTESPRDAKRFQAAYSHVPGRINDTLTISAVHYNPDENDLFQFSILIHEFRHRAVFKFGVPAYQDLSVFNGYVTPAGLQIIKDIVEDEENYSRHDWAMEMDAFVIQTVAAKMKAAGYSLQEIADLVTSGPDTLPLRMLSKEKRAQMAAPDTREALIRHLGDRFFPPTPPIVKKFE
jgi:hypothetical protein